ncbi:cytochrome P450 [Rhodobacterales bacterium HKCCE2091]|nr:cytochrome P450 [Rhodobacterales bacterium HKCCE2091]
MTLVEGHKQIAPDTAVPVWDTDPYDLEVLVDPYDWWADLRAKGDVVYIPRYSALMVGRYETTKKVFSDHENFLSSRGVGLDDFALSKPWRPPSIILEVDPPDHTKTRKVMSRAMSPKVAKALGEDFRQTADALVDEILEKGEIEAVVEFAEAFPTTVFPKAVGMTIVNKRHLVDYGAMVFNSIGPDNELRKDATTRVPEVARWIMEACDRSRLTDDGMGALLFEAADAGDITAEEASLLVRSFLSAGVDTTVTGIGNALWCLANNPAEWEALKADPSLTRPAFEEVLRYTSPVHTFCRTSGRDTEISGIPVEEGTKVICSLGSANMDPEKWGDPENFRVARKPVGHLAFGVGIHGCVGQNIARAELDAVLGALIAKVDRIEWTGDPVWRPNNAIHALDRLPLRFIAK